MTVQDCTPRVGVLDAVVEASKQAIWLRNRWLAIHEQLDAARLVESGAFAGHYQGRLTLDAYTTHRAPLVALIDAEQEAFDAYVEGMCAIDDAWVAFERRGPRHGGGRSSGHGPILRTVVDGQDDRDDARDDAEREIVRDLQADEDWCDPREDALRSLEADDLRQARREGR